MDRALYRCVYRGDRTYGCGDIVFSVGDHRQKLVCTNSLGIKGLTRTKPGLPLSCRAHHQMCCTAEKVRHKGDPLSMAFYALGVLPLIVQLKDLDKWIQIWYADDANNCGKLPLLREWFDMLVTKGPDFGYFPEPSKSILVVAECDIPETERLFSDIGIQICTSSRILGGHVGSSTGRKEYIQQKVLSWVHHVDCLAEAAGSQPQDAYAALTKSLSFEWTFVQRVVQECGDLFEPVEDMICNKFLPQLLGSEFTPEDRAVFALPVKFAGLGIPNPTTTAKNAFRTSKRAASHLTDAISGQGEIDHITHGQVVMEARTEHRGSRRQEHVANLNSTLAKFADDKQRIVRRAADHPIDNLQNYCLGTRYGARSRSRLCRRLSISLVRCRHDLEKFLEHHFIPIRRRFNPHDLPTDLLRVQDPFFGEEGRSFRKETTVHGPQWGRRRRRVMSCSCAVVLCISKAMSIFFFF